MTNDKKNDEKPEPCQFCGKPGDPDLGKAVCQDCWEEGYINGMTKEKLTALVEDLVEWI